MTLLKMSHKRREEARQLLEVLIDGWPQCFDLKPLKIGIRDDIAAALGEAADKRTLGNALSSTPAGPATEPILPKEHRATASTASRAAW